MFYSLHISAYNFNILLCNLYICDHWSRHQTEEKNKNFPLKHGSTPLIKQQITLSHKKACNVSA